MDLPDNARRVWALGHSSLHLDSRAGAEGRVRIDSSGLRQSEDYE
jgi:hypothetical protein